MLKKLALYFDTYKYCSYFNPFYDSFGNVAFWVFMLCFYTLLVYLLLNEKDLDFSNFEILEYLVVLVTICSLLITVYSFFSILLFFWAQQKAVWIQYITFKKTYVGFLRLHYLYFFKLGKLWFFFSILITHLILLLRFSAVYYLLPDICKKILNYMCIFLFIYWVLIFVQFFYIMKPFFAWIDVIDVLDSVKDFNKFMAVIGYCFMEVLLFTPNVFFYSLILAFLITIVLCIIIEYFFNK